MLPSSVVAVIVAVPFAIAVTLPVASTVATVGLLLVNVTFLFVASLGATVAERVNVSPAVLSSFAVGSTFTPVTATGAALTVKLTFFVIFVRFVAVTSTSAVYVPAANPVFGTTVNVVVFPESIVVLATGVILKFDLPVPASTALTFSSLPVPVFFIVNVSGVCAPYPSVAPVNVLPSGVTVAV